MLVRPGCSLGKGHEHHFLNSFHMKYFPGNSPQHSHPATEAPEPKATDSRDMVAATSC